MPSPLVGLLGRPFWYEGRAGAEAAELARSSVPLHGGDGRRVVLVTGYMAGPATVRPMRTWLEGAGFDVDVAHVGRNATSSSGAADRIVEALERDPNRPAVLIGHSRGGQQSRVAAYRRPELVSQLITLGAPVRHHLPRWLPLRATVEATRLVAKLPVGPADDPTENARYEADLFAPFDVDVAWTTIVSKLDGVVEWQACLDPAAESVEIRSSHAGLIASVASFEAIADVLRAGAEA